MSRTSFEQAIRRDRPSTDEVWMCHGYQCRIETRDQARLAAYGWSVWKGTVKLDGGGMSTAHAARGAAEAAAKRMHDELRQDGERWDGLS